MKTHMWLRSPTPRQAFPSTRDVQSTHRHQGAHSDQHREAIACSTTLFLFLQHCRDSAAPGFRTTHFNGTTNAVEAKSCSVGKRTHFFT